MIYVNETLASLSDCQLLINDAAVKLHFSELTASDVLQPEGYRQSRQSE